jgi:hypothetical protein
MSGAIVRLFLDTTNLDDFRETDEPAVMREELP